MTQESMKPERLLPPWPAPPEWPDSEPWAPWLVVGGLLWARKTGARRPETWPLDLPWGGPWEEEEELDWTELALQVQLYARTAAQVLARNARTGNVHFLKGNKRVQIPITQEAYDAALSNIEWAVKGILNSDFPMRPHPRKCEKSDFKLICPKIPQDFKQAELPPELQLPDRKEMARAFSLYQGSHDGG